MNLNNIMKEKPLENAMLLAHLIDLGSPCLGVKSPTKNKALAELDWTVDLTLSPHIPG